MSKIGTPKITNAGKDDYTRITFTPDLKKFGMERIDNDLEALLKKRVYDIAGCLQNTKVFLNNNRIKIKNFKQYVELYLQLSSIEGEPASTTKPPIVHERVNDRWEVCFTPSDGQFRQVSFVNNIATVKGGTHVNYVTEQIVTRFVEDAKKKHKGVTIKNFQVKNHLWIFVNALIENPAFDSQTKETLTLRSTAFGSVCSLSEKYMNQVMKTGVGENIMNFIKFKQNQMLKKTDGHKHSRISGIPKLDDANNAGTKNGGRCVLILTEGDSAKALAVSGLAVVGRDNYGVFPLRGKLLNVREASPQQISQNQEINNIKQILGLQHGKTYDSTSQLRYGHLMIMTDQDHDGSHIKGLVINFLDHFWPSLLRIPGFLMEFITPIVRVHKGKNNNRQELAFYTIPEYENWKADNNGGTGWTIKYYKGLGTSTSEDAKRYFKAMDKHLKPFSSVSPDDRALIDMAFNKKKADDRKAWLKEFEPGTFMDHSVKNIRMTDFINRELILFSMADNVRSIPSVVDGLKPGQRKIMYSCFKRNLKAELKVAQLAGYVSEHSAYHHGEHSLQTTIVGLAQNYVGSNNINLLEPIGQFGTRLQGGKDAASARYIFTSLSRLSRMIMHSEDDPIMNYLHDDGQKIEPDWYLPILPMVLVNGSDGIGTGWSSSVPNYNPHDIVENLQRMMNGDELRQMHPWYQGYAGTIQPAAKDKYTVSGKIVKLDSTTVEITELPIRKWTQDYKEYLELLLTGDSKTQPFIKDYKEYHTDTTVHFVVTLSEENMALAEEEGLEKRFRLTNTISLTNMVCFDASGKIRKYTSPEEILKDFYALRLDYYGKRKQWKLDDLTRQWSKASNRLRFVTEIVEGDLRVQNRRKTELIRELEKRGYDGFAKPSSKSSSPTSSNSEEHHEEDCGSGDGGAKYDYLLSMPIWNLTAEKIKNLQDERDAKSKELETLTAQSPKDLWNIDLDNFMAEWERVRAEYAEERSSAPKAVASSNNARARGSKSTGKSGRQTSIKSFVKTQRKSATDGDSQQVNSTVRPSKLKKTPSLHKTPPDVEVPESRDLKEMGEDTPTQQTQNIPKKLAKSRSEENILNEWTPTNISVPSMFARLSQMSQKNSPSTQALPARKNPNMSALFADMDAEKKDMIDADVSNMIGQIIKDNSPKRPRVEKMDSLSRSAKRAKTTASPTTDVYSISSGSDSEMDFTKKPPSLKWVEKKPATTKKIGSTKKSIIESGSEDSSDDFIKPTASGWRTSRATKPVNYALMLEPNNDMDESECDNPLDEISDDDY